MLTRDKKEICTCNVHALKELTSQAGGKTYDGGGSGKERRGQTQETVGTPNQQHWIPDSHSDGMNGQ